MLIDRQDTEDRVRGVMKGPGWIEIDCLAMGEVVGDWLLMNGWMGNVFSTQTGAVYTVQPRHRRPELPAEGGALCASTSLDFELSFDFFERTVYATVFCDLHSLFQTPLISGPGWKTVKWARSKF